MKQRIISVFFLVSNDARFALYFMFCNMKINENQKQFIASHVHKISKKRTTRNLGNDKRNFTYSYVLYNIYSQ